MQQTRKGRNWHFGLKLWGFAKLRYRGLAKSFARAQTMFELANPYQVRVSCSLQGRRVPCDLGRVPCDLDGANRTGN
jgi:hypothetical protein